MFPHGHQFNSQTKLASFVKQNLFKEDKLFSDINVHFNYGFILVEAALHNPPAAHLFVLEGNSVGSTGH